MYFKLSIIIAQKKLLIILKLRIYTLSKISATPLNLNLQAIFFLLDLAMFKLGKFAEIN